MIQSIIDNCKSFGFEPIEENKITTLKTLQKQIDEAQKGDIRGMAFQIIAECQLRIKEIIELL